MLPVGDPVPASWGVALLDLLACCVCLPIIFGRGVIDRRGRVFWLLLAATALALGVNQLADLQRVLLPRVGSTLEHQSLGSYSSLVTVAGATVVAIVAAATLVALWWLARPRRFRLGHWPGRLHCSLSPSCEQQRWGTHRWPAEPCLPAARLWSSRESVRSWCWSLPCPKCCAAVGAWMSASPPEPVLMLTSLRRADDLEAGEGRHGAAGTEPGVVIPRRGPTSQPARGRRVQRRQRHRPARRFWLTGIGRRLWWRSRGVVSLSGRGRAQACGTPVVAAGMGGLRTAVA